MNKNSDPYFYFITISEIENGYKWKGLPYYDILYRYILKRGNAYTSILFKIYDKLELEFSIIEDNTSIISLTVL